MLNVLTNMWFWLFVVFTTAVLVVFTFPRVRGNKEYCADDARQLRDVALDKQNDHWHAVLEEMIKVLLDETFKEIERCSSNVWNVCSIEISTEYVLPAIKDDYISTLLDMGYKVEEKSGKIKISW